MNPFELGLKRILEDRSIVKVFHDFCEDTAALVNHYDIHSEGVFDTQMAHRVLNKDSSDPKDQNINLNRLLEVYLGV